MARTLAAIDVNGLARPHRGQKGSDLVAVASSCYLLYSLVHIYEYMDD